MIRLLEFVVFYLLGGAVCLAAQLWAVLCLLAAGFSIDRVGFILTLKWEFVFFLKLENSFGSDL